VCFRVSKLPAGRVEIQVRTILQSMWANINEKLADDAGRGIRYGEQAVPPPGYDQERTDKVVQDWQTMSEMIAARETEWQQYVNEGNKVAVGGSAMQKAMIIGAVVVGIQQFNPEAGLGKEGGE
jgi:ppGpp synthetase/RelA/SpoT-type nucleotidyltranferase